MMKAMDQVVMSPGEVPAYIRKDALVKWLRVSPTEANPTMTQPPILRRRSNGIEILYDCDTPHLIIPPIITNDINNKVDYCHVYICGTGCNPTTDNTATWLLSVTGDVGIASIALSYCWGAYSDQERNDILFEKCNGDNDSIQKLLEAYHSDVLYGGNESGLVDVTDCNSIIGRLSSLIKYLSETRPVEENWKQFLSDIDISTVTNSTNKTKNLILEQIVFSGHSQGSGHVCALAQQCKLARAVLLSGPQEFIPYVLPSSLLVDTILLYNKEQDKNEASDNVSTSIDEVSISSWLDQPFATVDVMGFMHAHEEITEDLMRSNWSRIAPLHKDNDIYLNVDKLLQSITNSSINKVNIISESSCNNPELPLCIHRRNVNYRMVYSLITPSAVWDKCGGRPNHVSIVTDRNTPTLIITEEYLRQILIANIKRTRHLYNLCDSLVPRLLKSIDVSVSSEVIIPLYYINNVWSYFLLMDEFIIGNDAIKNEGVRVSKL